MMVPAEPRRPLTRRQSVPDARGAEDRKHIGSSDTFLTSFLTHFETLSEQSRCRSLDPSRTKHTKVSSALALQARNASSPTRRVPTSPSENDRPKQRPRSAVFRDGTARQVAPHVPSARGALPRGREGHGSPETNLKEDKMYNRRKPSKCAANTTETFRNIMSTTATMKAIETLLQSPQY